MNTTLHTCVRATCQSPDGVYADELCKHLPEQLPPPFDETSTACRLRPASGAVRCCSDGGAVWMIALISARQEPQLVPAFSAVPMSSTLARPAAAAAIWLTPT